MNISPINKNNHISFKSLSVQPDKFMYPELENSLLKNKEIMSFADSLHKNGFDLLIRTVEFEELGHPEYGRKLSLAFDIKKIAGKLQNPFFKKKSIKFLGKIEDTLADFNAEKTLKMIKKV